MARIFLDMEKLKSLNSGLGQFCYFLGGELKDFPGIGFYVPDSHDKWNSEIESLNWKRVHQFSKVPLKLDLWHSTHQEAKYFPKKYGALVLTIHDLNFLEKYEGNKVKGKLKKLQKLVDKADGIVYISEFTKKVAQQNLNIPGQCLEAVIYNGNCIQDDAVSEKPLFVGNGDFIFNIGVIGEKKNLEVLLPMMKFLDLKLYICGNKNSSYAKELEGKVEQYGVADKVIFGGELSGEEKLWMFENAAGYVFPSKREGFGLPAIEALSFGLPTVLSNLTSLPEVGGEAAAYFDSFNPEDMARVVRNELARNDDVSSNARKAHAAQFSWATSAKEYYAFYESVIQKKGLRRDLK